jgi:hypothetical protein
VLVLYCFECVCVILCFLCIVLCIVVPLPPGTYPLAVNNNNNNLGHALGLLVEALCYKSEGCGFDFRWVTEIFQWLNPSGCTISVGSTQFFDTNEYQKSSLGSKGGRCVRLITLPPLRTHCLRILEVSTSWSSRGLSSSDLNTSNCAHLPRHQIFALETKSLTCQNHFLHHSVSPDFRKNPHKK